jgi:hypothetical protein
MRESILVVFLTALLVLSVSAYPLDDLIRKLNGYNKKWVSGLNSKFIDLSL